MTPATAPQTPPNLRLLILSIGLLLLLSALDQSIVSTALPTIVADLGGVDHLAWVVTAYILASTVVAPLYGKLGDLYGRRGMVFLAVGLFLAGSAACGISQSMTQLILARALQGLGGGGIFVLALSVIGDVIPPKDRAKTQGVFAAVFSVSSVIGPLMGGWFVDTFSWHWIFFINIPLGVLAIAGFAASFTARPERVSHKIDWAGAALLSLALAALTLATSLGGRSFAWGSSEILGLAAGAIVATLLFLWVEARAAEPILPLGLFRGNVFTTTSVLGFIVGACMFGSVTFLPLYLQLAKGVTPTVSGLMLVPMTAGILTATTFAGRYMGQTGRYRILPFIGLSALTLGLLSLTRLSVDTSTLVFSLCIALTGFGLGNLFPVLTTTVQNAVPRAQLGTATAAGIMFRQIGGSVGVAAFGALFASRMAENMAHVAPGAEAMSGMGGTVSPEGGAATALRPELIHALPPEVQQAIGTAVVNALHPIFWIAAGLAAFGLIFAVVLKEIPLANRMVPKGE